MLTALLISLICVLFVAVSTFWLVSLTWIVLPVLMLVVFGISYPIVHHMLSGFILEKIDPIYKQLEEIPVDKKGLLDKMKEKDVFREVNGLVMNYTERKAKEIKKLRRLERYRKEFLGNVSHELKTPIFNIQGYILTLLEGGLEDPEINREYLERTEKSINRMISIIEDLESITKLEAGELQLTMENFDIVDLIRNVFELQDALCSKYDIRLEFKRNYEKPVMVKADKARITEVLNNLIVNSIHYGNRGGKTTVRIDSLGNNILVEVRDNGIGIEKEYIPRIFERFYRIDKSRSRDGGGTGLGLSIVRHIIEAHKQTISVSSKPGKGSSFSFTLKRA